MYSDSDKEEKEDSPGKEKHQRTVSLVGYDHIGDEEDSQMEHSTPLSHHKTPPSSPREDKNGHVPSSSNDKKSPHISSQILDSLLPPSRSKECDPRLKEKLHKFHQMKLEGKSINKNLNQSKAFRNPEMLEKLISHCDINEIDSNYPRHLWNPFGFYPSDYYDALETEQNLMYEQQKMEKMGIKPSNSISTVSSSSKEDTTKKDTTTTKDTKKEEVKSSTEPSTKEITGKTDIKDETRKRSKWDEEPSAPPVLVETTTNPPEKKAKKDSKSLKKEDKTPSDTLANPKYAEYIKKKKEAETKKQKT